MILYYKFRAILVTWLLRLLPRTAPVVFQGKNSALVLCEQVAVLGFDKIIILTDGFLGASGILDTIKKTLTENAVEYFVYDGVLPDPTFDKVQEAQALLTEKNCQAILAIGGGSVLDAAKVTALLHTNPGELSKFNGIQKFKNPAIPLFAIPTTAGTGAEITIAAVISDPVSHRKTPVVDSKMIPGYIALDPVIMQGLPPGLTAATGMDALTHAIESYLAKSSTKATEVQAKAAIKLVFKYLLKAYQDGTDMESREAMALASFYAGSAFDKTSVGYVHGIAHQLGRVCKTPHGNANAMVLPEVLKAYGPIVHSSLAELALFVGIGKQGDPVPELAAKFLRAIEKMRDDMGIPRKPDTLNRHEISGMAKEVITEAGNLYPVPRYMSKAEISNILDPLAMS